MAAAHEPEVIRDKAAMRAWTRRRRAEGKAVALVPTMGYLHNGHLSLVSAAAAASAGPVAVVVSIYVNPGQFAPTEDLTTYPSDLAGDLRKLAAVFCPPDLYVRAGDGRPDAGSSGGTVSCLEQAGGGYGHETWIRVEQLEKGLCGSSRPVFFRGVATVVAKLFNIVDPDIAVLGKKDYQQWRVICRMVRDLDFAIEIIGSEIVREADCLAMSSRNVHLSREEREKDNNLKALHRTRSARKNGNPCCKCRYDDFVHSMALSISRSLVNARTAALNGNNHSQQIQDQIVQTLTEAGDSSIKQRNFRNPFDVNADCELESLVPLERVDRPAVICVATWFGKVRLIENTEIQAPP
ncbi:Pantoate--beta-alanine ligase [Dichanthelium oligosanthes]|uniref:Pantoate--beta-alanine ligase n=1 Tax=Dichanthelium oligosanthes TaxID=888268 RepID=A0A1E5W2N1_9POAL|nr:Pantoate--beta-alanine ligase [Dichanthelium oligosanthes]